MSLFRQRCSHPWVSADSFPKLDKYSLGLDTGFVQYDPEWGVMTVLPLV